MIYLRGVSIPEGGTTREEYPFTVPALRELEQIEFNTPVTLLVGENGSGKSTLLEAMALKAKLPPATGVPLDKDPTLQPVEPLAKAMRLSWLPRTKKGFFLRAEDFFNFARSLKTRGEEMQGLADRFADDARVRGYMLAQKAAMDNRYGEDLHAMSHGESFLQFFQARFVPKGLYLIDEPEAALSPQRQLAFISLMKRIVEEEEAQLIVATHSPLLLAYPGARILQFNEDGVKETAFDELEHVSLMRSFLSNPDRFVRDL